MYDGIVFTDAFYVKVVLTDTYGYGRVFLKYTLHDGMVLADALYVKHVLTGVLFGRVLLTNALYDTIV